MTVAELKRAAAEVRLAVQMPQGQYADFRGMLAVAAHLQVRVARIMMIPGEPIWGLTITPLQPGTADEDHLYALVRQVANNHACPFGKRRLLLTWEELQDVADMWGMLISAYDEGAYPRNVVQRHSDEAVRRAAWKRQRQNRAAKLHSEREARQARQREIAQGEHRQRETDAEVREVLKGLVDRVVAMEGPRMEGPRWKDRAVRTVRFAERHPEVRLVEKDLLIRPKRCDLVARRDSRRRRLRARWSKQEGWPNLDGWAQPEDWADQERKSKRGITCPRR